MTKKSSIKWESISITSSDFIKAEQKQVLNQLLHEYFTLNKNVSPRFIIELAEKYPELLLRSIRVNRVFLNPNHANSLSILK